jgi:tetratricopeptide (TPR) repeat protein
MGAGGEQTAQPNESSRADLQAAVQARLERVARQQDLAPVLEPGAAQQAHELAGLLGDDPEDLDSWLMLGWFHWYRYQALPEGQDRPDLDTAIAVLAHCFLGGTGLQELPDVLVPALAIQVVPAARSLLEGALSSPDLQMISAAVIIWRRIIAAIPEDHPGHVERLSTLGVALGERFGRTGVIEDLDEAILVIRKAVAATPDGHVSLPGMLSNLGNALRKRAERTDALADLEEAIQVCRQAVAATLEDAIEYPVLLSVLGGTLGERFGRTGVIEDLDEAIRVLRQAVAATPDGAAGLPSRLSNFGIALEDRFERTGVMADLDEAIRAGRRAVAAAPDGHTELPRWLTNFGIALRDRFGRTGVMADLDEAIRVIRQAVAAAPDDHPGLIRWLSSLGIALRDRFARTGAKADLDEAVDAFGRGMDVGGAAPSARIRAAREASRLAAETRPGWAADVMERAVRLLPEVAPRELERSDQQHALGRLSGLAGDAAALVLADVNTGGEQRAARALGLLEVGRAVLLSQSLDTRSDLTDLHGQHPALAQRFIELRDALDQPEEMPVLRTDIDIAQSGRSYQDRQQLAKRLSATVAEIRALDGFASFALPPAADELITLAARGPVVTFNISPYRSDALLLTKDGITALNLPRLTHDTLIDHIGTFYKALLISTDPREDRRAAQRTMTGILEWLWDAAAEPVLNALGHTTGQSPDQNLPRVWWAPGGLLSLLPLHAAGYHTETVVDGQVRRTVMDTVISSYTPTIRALRYARQHVTAAPAEGLSLIVAMPSTPRLPGSELPNVPSEAARVRALLPHPVVLTEPGSTSGEPSNTSGDLPTRANVLALLPGCSIAHFACHAASHPSDPSRSLLLLHDHDRNPLTVASLAPVNLGQAQLAYLSACSTALTSAVELIDEAIHLTSAFQLAGFPHVIGTLWAIDDKIAVTVAEAFYTILLTGALDVSDAARALHGAVRDVRDRFPTTPSLWAAYLHAGD